MERALEPARPFAAMRAVPRPVRVPPLVGALIGAAVAAGPVVGAASRRAPAPLRVVRATFWSAALGYLVTSLVDFAEHFRLEKAATGHYLRAAVVPRGETLNHAATIATVVSSLALARPIRRRRLGARDVWLLAAPAAFLALGWRDEFVYHRRRSTHREDMMHTIPHLAAGVMWTALYAMRLVDWRR
jgi:prepilin signal peptidase PulO-like enzyme (type II secretory pathway)